MDEGNVVFIVCDDSAEVPVQRRLHAAGGRGRQPRVHRLVVAHAGLRNAGCASDRRARAYGLVNSTPPSAEEDPNAQHRPHGARRRPGDRAHRARPQEASSLRSAARRQRPARVQGVHQRRQAPRRRGRPPRPARRVAAPGDHRPDLLDRVVAHARRDAPNECCGLVATRDGRATSVHETENTAASPFRFEVDGMALYRAMSAIEDGRR